MSLSFDRVLAIGALISINTAKLFSYNDNWVEKVIQGLGLACDRENPANPTCGSSSSALYKGVGVLTIAQIMMAVNGMDRLDQPGCRQITDDRVRRSFYVGAIVTAFLLPEFIYHSSTKSMAPTNRGTVGLAAVLFGSALVTMRSGWHLRESKCNKNRIVWQVWFGEGIVAMAMAGLYAFYALKK